MRTLAIIAAFLAGPAAAFEDAAPCGHARSDVGVTVIVISVSAAQVPFGITTDVAQYFQLYRFQDGMCIWDAF